jgi:hypothetical protein
LSRRENISVLVKLSSSIESLVKMRMIQFTCNISFDLNQSTDFSLSNKESYRS